MSAEVEQGHTPLTKDQARRVRRAMGNAPGGASTSLRHYAGVSSVEDVVEWIEHYVVVVQDLIGHFDGMDRELFTLQEQRRAVRAFFGTDKL
jgi:hypothetical protein